MKTVETIAAPPGLSSGPTDQFLAMLGHELRNPLSAVANAVATIRMSGAEHERALAIAERGLEHLGRLIDDILDAARLRLLARLFDPFVQAERGYSRSEGGLGIGLSVVKELVEQHQGVVSVRSDGPGHGTEFEVRLPIATLGSSMAESSPSPGPRVRDSIRVLVVDDDSDVAESLAVILEPLGHRVRTSSDGPSGLSLGAYEPPDLMIVDIGLPGMDGHEVARRARANATLRDTILVALTVYGGEEDRRCALAAGFDHHLVKPVDPQTLIDLVSAHGAGSGQGRNVRGDRSGTE